MNRNGSKQLQTEEAVSFVFNNSWKSKGTLILAEAESKQLYSTDSGTFR